MVKKKYKYALYRTTGVTKEKALHSMHFTKENAEKAKKRAERQTPFRKPFNIRKLK